MHFSCKITNAILTYLEDQGEDVSSLYENCPLPPELLRDPSYWLSAPSVESFLESVLRLPRKNLEEDIIRKIGHLSPQILAWGVLDSVLRMMPRPQEVLNQPARFISYFISPEPPLENIRRTENSLSFDLPLQAEHYPLVSRYLMAAFESLPLYVGAQLASCEWKDIHFRIEWAQNQSELFVEPETSSVINPSLLQNIIDDLQSGQRELEEKNRELMDRNEELLRMQKAQARQISQDLLSSPDELLEGQDLTSGPMHEISQNLARLHDYMVRAQQLITLLMSQSKMTPGLKEVLRRIDWDHVKNQYPRTISECVDSLRTLQFHQKNIQSKGNQEESPHV